MVREGRIVGDTDRTYVVCRVGSIGSTWDTKRLEHRSAQVVESRVPVWEFEFKAPADAEIQVRVYDATSDEVLGEVIVRTSELGEEREYELSSRDGSRVTMLGGECVERHVVETATSWWEGARRLASLFGDESLSYRASMAALGASFALPCGHETDPSSSFFDAQSSSGGDSSFPHLRNSVSYSAHAKCKRLLAELGNRIVEGDVERQNFLGFAMLNSRLWPEVPWHCMGLGAPPEIHAWIRPLLCEIFGPSGRWRPCLVAERARDFFRGRGRVDVPADLRAWTTKVLHEISLGVRLTDAEALEFIEFQQRALAAAMVPEGALVSRAVEAAIGLDEILAFKRQWLGRHRAAVLMTVPALRARDEHEIEYFLSCVLDALVFAGGQSVPTVLGFAICVPYSAWGEANLPPSFSLDDMTLHGSYVWETIRRFPPVAGFCYFEKSRRRPIFCNLRQAQRDPRVWGDVTFYLRPEKDYDQHMIGFAEFAVAPSLASPQSRSCPAKALTFHMISAFLKEFASSAAHVGHERLWRPFSASSSRSGESKPLEPRDIVPTSFGITPPLVLLKDMDVVDPPLAEPVVDPSSSMIPRHRHRANRFNLDVDAHTKLFIGVVQSTVDPSDRPKSLDVPAIFDDSVEDDAWRAPFAGLKLLKVDEDRPTGPFARLARIAFFRTSSMALDFSENNLAYFASNSEAAACAEETFGPYLPDGYVSWPHLATDRGLVDLVVAGVGAWYLRARKEEEEEETDHAVPDGAFFEANVEYIGKYETRPPWKTYGATLYLDRDLQPVGIWSCHRSHLAAPRDDAWDEAKADFRMSLGTSLTLRDHLAVTHWIVANGLARATRAAFTATHPLRRLLKQFTFLTASVNDAAKDMLLPERSLGHRTFGLTWSAWVSYFTDVFEAWVWIPLPEKIQRAGLPQDLLDRWPLAQDGLRLWHTFERYVGAYLSVFYDDDDDDDGKRVDADPEICAFWSHFETQFDTPWNLPALSLNTLRVFLADLIWHVTAGHELHGAIVEYINAPDGFCGKLAEGRLVPDIQSQAQALIVIALTGTRQPGLCNDWTHLFQDTGWPADKSQAVLDVVRQFQVDLDDLANNIDERNEDRAFRGERRVTNFNPRVLETSVSV
ncbi:hypothetical protein CTAYLR_006969 [Chrysophaeum taylorii]|uniref:Lipoxygenase domain-containing protein n=1 Tax=Chrysophaeum taylorii TaxID=2483200 RepID=A0AAD7XKS8_9STRA|nr:hypothetical protein CTAYLR_006969 [Chrysophaeum taylorii]